MITCFTGTPGGGKTYAAVKLMLDMLKKGRTVYSNVDGHDSPMCRGAIAHLTGLEYEQVEKQLIYLNKEAVKHFWDIVAPGAVVMLDEVHKIWSSRTYASDSNKAMAEWCSTHRHTGNDVILMTQGLDKLDGHVRGLIEWTHRCRKVNFVGSLMKNSYLEYVFSEDDDRNSLSRKRFAYDRRIFHCYESYASKQIKEKGIGKATNILKHPIFLAIPVVLAISLYMLFFKSGIAHGDLFGAKKHLKKQEAALHKVPPVNLDKGAGYYQEGKWVSDSSVVPPKADQGAGAGGKAPDAQLPAGPVYHAPARIEVQGKVWTFTDSESGRVIGTVTFSDGPKFTAKNGVEPDRRETDLEKEVAVALW
jgi:zona occludens toxin (predicted ATPase)